MKSIFKTLLFGILFAGAIGLQGQTTVLWPTADSTTIKQSQFSGGLTGWTVKGISSAKAVWTWTAKGNANGASFLPASFVINSPSAANGAAVFNSDSLDNGGLGAANIGKGPAPSPQQSELISPTMNTAGYTNLVVKFNQALRNFQPDSLYVSWSEDGGTTWKPNVIIDKTVFIYQYTALNDVQYILLPGSVGSANFKIKFGFAGDYYAWIIDDVQVLGKVNHLKVDEDFYARAPDRVTPVSQLDSIVFLADVSNKGSNKASNVQLIANFFKVATVTGGTDTKLFSTSSTLGTINSGDTVQNTLLATKYLPPAVTGSYYGQYTLKSDSTDIAGNSSINYNLTISDSTFAKEVAATQTIGPAFSGTDHSVRMGNYYYIPHGLGYRATSAVIGINNADALKGQLVGVRLYKWSGKTDANGLIPVAERGDPIGYADWTVAVTGGTTDTLITLPLTPVDPKAKSVVLADKGEYLLMIEYDNTSGKNPDITFDAGSYNDYAAMNLATQLTGHTKYAGILGVNTIKDTWAPVTFSGGAYRYVPVARLNIGKIASATNDLSAANKMEIYPNPTKDVLNIDLDLVNLSPEASIQIMDLNGREVITRSLKNAQKESVQLDVRSLASGTYLLQVITKDGARAKKFVIAK